MKTITVGEMREALNNLPDNAILSNPMEGRFIVTMPEQKQISANEDFKENIRAILEEAGQYAPPKKEMAAICRNESEYDKMEEGIQLDTIRADVKKAKGDSILAINHAIMTYGTSDYSGALINLGACVDRLGQLYRKESYYNY